MERLRGNIETGEMMIAKRSYGKLRDSREAFLYTMVNKNNLSISVCNYGGTLVSVLVPDRYGNICDVVLGFDEVAGYENQHSNIGVTIGRYANRIHKGTFILNNKVYHLQCNSGHNHIHGGYHGFSHKLWNVMIEGNEIKFQYYSKDGEEGYPGNLDVSVTYSLNDENELEIQYYAVSDQDTIINLTNHSYFSLNGHNSFTADNQYLQINANYFMRINEKIETTGELCSVKQTPMDFRQLTRIKDQIDNDYEQLRNVGGYDHNWVLNKFERDILSFAAELFDDNSGRSVTIFTTKPGIQFYSGNFLDNSEIGKEKVSYSPRAGICLEPQYFPNSMEYNFLPSPVLRMGEEYKHKTVYKFNTK